MPPQKIFLSYSRDDTALMQRLRDDLRAAGFQVWTDESIQPGSPSWKMEIESAIRDSDCLLVIFSPDAAESRWVRAEIDFAETLKKPLFSVLARGDETNAVPFGMTTHQWIDLRDLSRYDSGMTMLTKSIRSQLGQHHAEGIPAAPAVPLAPPPKAQTSRRLGLLTAVLLLALGVGAAGLVWMQNSPQPAATATPSINVDDERVERRSGEIVLSVPASWNQDIDPAFALDMVNQIAGDSAKAEAFLTAIPQDYELFIGDWSQLIAFGVIAQELPVRFSLEVLRDRSTQLYALINMEVTESEIEDFTAGEMLRLVAESRSPVVSGGNIVYYLYNGKTLYYTVFFVGESQNLNAELDALLPVTDEIMESFRLEDAPASG